MTKLTTIPLKSEEAIEVSNIQFVQFNSKKSVYVKVSPKHGNIINYSLVKEKLYLKAIDNLMKKNEFLQLMVELLQNQITEEEYEKELFGNREKYFIDLQAIESPDDYNAIISICKNLKSSITVDEISEIFGIQQSGILTAIEA